MGGIRQFRHSFAAGHIDPSFLSRSDSAEFDSACEILENFELTLSGAIKRRGGSLVQDTISVGSRLIDWEFDDGTKWVVDLNTDGYARIRPKGGTAGETVNLSLPELTFANVVDELDYTQQLNTLILAHPLIPTVRIVRDGTDFTIEPLPFSTSITGAEQRAMHRFTDTRDLYMRVGALTGETTVTTQRVIDGEFVNVNTYWQPSHIGRWFKYEDTWFRVESLVGDIPPTAAVNVTIFGSIPNVYQLRLFPADDYQKFEVGDILTGAETGATVEVVGEVAVPNTPNPYWWPYLIVRPITGQLKAPGLWLDGQASTSVTENVSNGAESSRTNMLNGAGPGADQGGSLNWLEEAWSPTRGYPGAVAVHAGRLWFGGSSSLPEYLWGSKAQDYFNFDYGEGFPNDAISAPVVGPQNQTVRYLVAGPVLEVLTDQAEYFVPGWENRPITPETFTLIQSSSHGVLRGCKPARLAYATFFVDRSGAALYRQYYDDQIRSLKAELMSGAATSLIKNPRQLARQRGRKSEGQEVLWGVNADGTAFQFRWWPATGAMAFAGMGRSAGHAWRSMCYLDDIRYAVADVNGTRLLEESTDSCLLDAHQRLEAAETATIWTVPDWFAPGTSVDVVTDEAPDGATMADPFIYLGAFTVTAEQTIEIPSPGRTRIFVGATAEAVCQPTPIDFVPMAGDTRGMVKKVISYTLPLLSCWYLRVNERELWARQPAAGDFPVPLSNTDQRVWQLGYGNRQAPRLVSDKPLPVTVLGMAAEVQI